MRFDSIGHHASYDALCRLLIITLSLAPLRQDDQTPSVQAKTHLLPARHNTSVSEIPSDDDAGAHIRCR